jgi:hypothetical protein
MGRIATARAKAYTDARTNSLAKLLKLPSFHEVCKAMRSAGSEINPTAIKSGRECPMNMAASAIGRETIAIR